MTLEDIINAVSNRRSIIKKVGLSLLASLGFLQESNAEEPRVWARIYLPHYYTEKTECTLSRFRSAIGYERWNSIPAERRKNLRKYWILLPLDKRESYTRIYENPQDYLEKLGPEFKKDFDMFYQRLNLASLSESQIQQLNKHYNSKKLFEWTIDIKRFNEPISLGDKIKLFLHEYSEAKKNNTQVRDPLSSLY